jgi:hypothetical protein
MSYAPTHGLVLNLLKTVFRGPSNAVAKDFRPSAIVILGGARKFIAQSDGKLVW